MKGKIASILHSLLHFQILLFLSVLFLYFQFSIVDKILSFHIEVMLRLIIWGSEINRLQWLRLKKKKLTLMRISLTFSCASCMIKFTICLTWRLASEDIFPLNLDSIKTVKEKGQSWKKVDVPKTKFWWLAENREIVRQQLADIRQPNSEKSNLEVGLKRGLGGDLRPRGLRY